MSGLEFANGRGRWIKEFDIQASDDNTTFIPWGSFSMLNFTSMAIFVYPIRARFFRLTVQKYVNHYVDPGFVLPQIKALVSNDQPFTCACPMLSSGACCPFINMTVRNDQCVWCMDPNDIMTHMENGCGKCKAGTFEHEGRCFQHVTHQTTNSLSVGRSWSNGVDWRIEVNLTADTQSGVILFMERGTPLPKPCNSSGQKSVCCLNEIFQSKSVTPLLWSVSDMPSSACRIDAFTNPPTTVKQFVQFDRGRNVLTLTENEVRAWTTCTANLCTASIGVLFATAMTSLPAVNVITQLIRQPMLFDLSVPNLVCTTSRDLAADAHFELHHYVASNTYSVRVSGFQLRGVDVLFQWADSDVWIPTPNAPEIAVSVPPNNMTALRIRDGVNVLRADAPITTVVHGAVTHDAYAGIVVEISYGFGFSDNPSFGDTDQIAVIVAKSTQPVRLRRLITTNEIGETTTYTTSKGFISDNRRVIDLGIACYQDETFISKWLLQALQLLDTPGLPYTAFIKRSCRLVLSGEAAKAFWLVPWRGRDTSRTSEAGVNIEAEFA